MGKVSRDLQTGGQESSVLVQAGLPEPLPGPACYVPRTPGSAGPGVRVMTALKFQALICDEGLHGRT